MSLPSPITINNGLQPPGTLHTHNICLNESKGIITISEPRLMIRLKFNSKLAMEIKSTAAVGGDDTLQ